MRNKTPRERDHFETILDSVADGVFTVDEAMHITWFNRAAQEITGFSKEEAIGQPCCEIFRSSICLGDCPLHEALKSGQDIVNREVDILDKNNREIPISVSASVLRDTNGKAVGGVETFRDLSQLHALEREVTQAYSFHDLVSRNPAMRRLFDILPDVAASDATVLVQGESGTGKELLTKALHDLSNRGAHPLVTVNCGALPEALLEAEIFGVKKGAYTGAVSDRPGRLQMAQGGTLFLDEIGDLPLSLQVKLLRVLENREYQTLGDSRSRYADVRFIAATHRQLETMVEQGLFRRDLFFRLNVVSLTIPSLKERGEDIPLLLDMALDRFNRTYARKIQGFSAKALQALLNYDYPGNIRELLNLVERSVILCRHHIIELEDLPPLNNQLLYPAAEPVSVHAAEAEELRKLLERCNGNRAEAARKLGINRTTLWRRLKRLNME